MLSILITIAVAAALLTWELARPARVLPTIPGWLPRTLLATVLQALTAGAAGWWLDPFLAGWQPWSLRWLSWWWQGLVGYLVVTLVFYGWHRARHASPFLWRHLHQFHHSPERLEVITSFYKHPLEQILNSLLCGVTLLVVVGCSPAGAALAMGLAGVAELVYHANLRTPWWMGFVFQRPEQHRWHHRRGGHRGCYADLPLWDLCFGTWANPHDDEAPCGFPDAGELRVRDLLLGREVPA